MAPASANLGAPADPSELAAEYEPATLTRLARLAARYDTDGVLVVSAAVVAAAAGQGVAVP